MTYHNSTISQREKPRREVYQALRGCDWQTEATVEAEAAEAVEEDATVEDDASQEDVAKGATFHEGDETLWTLERAINVLEKIDLKGETASALGEAQARLMDFSFKVRDAERESHQLVHQLQMNMVVKQAQLREQQVRKEAQERCAVARADAESKRACPVCLVHPKNTAFQCGHALCSDCAARPEVTACPTCRAKIVMRLELFLE